MKAAPQRERGTEMLNTLCGLEPRARRRMRAKGPLLAYLSLNQAPKKTAQRTGEQADKKPSDVFRRFVCQCAAISYFPSLNQAPKKTAQRAGEQADKKRQQVFAVVYLSVRSSFERGILRADESRPRSSIPSAVRADESRPRSSIPSAVLARGKTKYARKRSAQNLVHLPACAVSILLTAETNAATDAAMMSLWMPTPHVFLPPS